VIEDDVAFREPLCRIEVSLSLDEFKRLVGLEHLEDALDPGQSGLCHRIR